MDSLNQELEIENQQIFESHVALFRNREVHTVIPRKNTIFLLVILLKL